MQKPPITEFILLEGVSTLSVGLLETPMSIRDDPGLPQRSNQHKKPLVKKGQILGKIFITTGAVNPLISRPRKITSDLRRFLPNLIFGMHMEHFRLA